MHKSLGKTPEFREGSARISRRKLLQTGTGLFALSCVPSKILGAHPSKSLELITRTSQALGTSVAAKVLHHDVQQAQHALEIAFKALKQLEKVLSIYQPDSQVSQLNEAGVVLNPDPLFVEIMEQSIRWSRRSVGAFDVTVQPLWALFQLAKNHHALPTAFEIKEARSKVNWEQVTISPS